jgi:polyhydroxyalkanoate synthesis regulator phasin
MEDTSFSEDALKRVYQDFSEKGILSRAREEAKDGSFLSLQHSLREMERKREGLHYRERFESLSDRIKKLQERIEKAGN